MWQDKHGALCRSSYLRLILAPPRAGCSTSHINTIVCGDEVWAPRTYVHFFDLVRWRIIWLGLTRELDLSRSINFKRNPKGNHANHNVWFNIFMAKGSVWLNLCGLINELHIRYINFVFYSSPDRFIGINLDNYVQFLQRTRSVQCIFKNRRQQQYFKLKYNRHNCAERKFGFF